MRLLAVCLLAATAACTGPPPVADDAAGATSMGGQEPEVTQAPVASPTPPPSAVPALQPSAAPALQPMAYADFEAADLLGSGCTFHAPDDRNIVFVAKAEGDAGVKIDGTVRPMRAHPADYDHMTRGVTATGAGLDLSVSPRPGEGTQSGYETRDWPATLMVTAKGGAPQTLAGVWQCGS